MGQQRDIEVEKDDQTRINKFSRLNMRYDELDGEIAKLRKKVQTYKDAIDEVSGCMEEDGVLLRVGEVYTAADEDTVNERLEKCIEEDEARLRGCTDEIEEVKTQMDALKKVLYSKFGSSINLEK